MTEVTPAPAAPLNAVSAAGTPAQLPAPTTPAVPEQPPWGNDFDAEKAWNLVKNLRDDKEKLSQRPVLTPEQQRKLDEYTRLEEASKSDLQRVQESEAAARRDADSSQAEAMRLRVAIEHGLGSEDIDLLGSGTQDEVSARAKRIAELRSAATATTPAVPPVPGQRPVEQLRPGATPSGAQSEDQANYEQLFGPGSWAKTQ